MMCVNFCLWSVNVVSVMYKKHRVKSARYFLFYLFCISLIESVHKSDLRCSYSRYQSLYQ